MTTVAPVMPVVVTGPAGSGKSKLAKAIALRGGWQHVNVGDVLKEHLLASGVTVNHRRDIGPAYLRLFKLEGYVRTVHGLLLLSGHVIDGVRIASALTEARDKRIQFFHVVRSGDPTWRLAPSEPYAREMPEMKQTLDYDAPWTWDKADLFRVADAIVNEVRRKSYPAWDDPSGEIRVLSGTRR